MNATQEQEYLCPHCSHINALKLNSHHDMYREQYTQCAKCDSRLEVVPADGIGEKINLVVSLVASELPIR